ncbi:YesL family protein [Amphibacillus cookii]|uniref:YesL family protein n=1 Tax=Amphibacillus cookii TaxID=767787 RepID=UPI0019595449|nr:DUF624 domain-containing protein [Amphibacillus cookii]MBM7541559.1 putative membrane protein YesL [Amphibacillus cookii]
MKDIGIRSSFQYIFEWVMLLAWLNLLWIVFTLMGLVVFGWAPATAAMFNVLRAVYRENNLQQPIFQIFYHAYRKNFFKVNGLGLLLMVIVTMISFGIMTLPYLNALSLNIMLVLYTMVISLFLMMVVFIFPAFTHYQTRFINYFKYALLISISYFQYTLLIGLTLLLTYILFRAFPGLFLFFSISIPSALVMAIALKVFKQIESQAGLVSIES